VEIAWVHLGRSRLTGYVGMGLAGAAALILLLSTWSGLNLTLQAVAHGHKVDSYEAFEGTRRDSGYFLSRATQPGQVVATCFGWPAFLDEKAVIKETCPLSTRKPVDPPTWGTEVSFPEYTKPVAPHGATVVWQETSELGGNSWVWKVPGRPAP